MGEQYAKLKTVLKNRENIHILKDIPVCIVNKYWIKISIELKEEIQFYNTEPGEEPIFNIGYSIIDDDGIIVATVVDYIHSETMYEDKALLKLTQPLNYFEVVKFGVDMDHIVFDYPQTWLKTVSKLI